MPAFSIKENQLITDLLSIIALKLVLLPKPDNERKLRMAAISITSAAESYINQDSLRPSVSALKDFVIKAVDNESYIKMAEGEKALKQKLEEFSELLLQKVEAPKQKGMRTFIYRYAYKLASMAGKEFANIGRNVSAGDAEVLLVIRDVLHIQE
ncbi:MAG: hypothetical protein KKB51_15340 [Candidatus Riflebacteria bacterium]|nr:hypothetical protein [Candidatus Riflebacteria bacterium]